MWRFMLKFQVILPRKNNFQHTLTTKLKKIEIFQKPKPDFAIPPHKNHIHNIINK
jgi:hypothetical protein